MRRLYLGTKNKDKLREIEEILVGLPLELALVPRDVPEVSENGTTIEENARKKALGYAQAMGAPVIADDTGLFVDALDGEPGVHAAIYAGAQHSYEDNRKKLLQELAGVPEAKRTAHFRTVIALARPGQVVATFEGKLEGRILEQPRGPRDFGYSPLFFVPEAGKTLSELTPEERRRLSHRGRALEKARPALLELI
jgi:XTP/dITP diphosphohydrolase